MSTYKRVDGDYNIVSIDPTNGDNVHITTHTVNITGNLDVQGNVTYINTEELTVEDPFITVAGNNTGTIGTAAYQEQGLVAQSSANTYAGIRFNNSTLEWQISSSVAANGAPISAYVPIGTSVAGSVGGPLNSIQFHDAGNVFGGDAALSWDSATGQLTLDGHLKLGNVGTTPTPVANTVIVYHKESSGVGGSGVYALSTTQDVELIDKQAAILYSIIF